MNLVQVVLLVGAFIAPALAYLKHEQAVQIKIDSWEKAKEAGQVPRPYLKSYRGGELKCTNGKVAFDSGYGQGLEEFPCDEVDLLSFVASQELNLTARHPKGIEWVAGTFASSQAFIV
eukprot:CAMPEP_0204888674 /NCGR_PEP_ID=MMETSP1349-20130617/20848_1 /ASSEMBLY_ACC=CAM_ASM_000710 /TAXON_ID=215587 /ORGANISM="Aplanochytrium stocchinoi, Strain GSBS06" /LENGTH=117 /DNA_ID=CAMNT_0052052271 /DNA_START=118 /DNA_END=471 /DNA_ORIENTATION=-